MSQFDNLRQRHPRFVYERYAHQWDAEQHTLRLAFRYRVEPDIVFTPQVLIENVQHIPDGLDLDPFVFHLGLIEILSYWKATCSPEIVIEAGYLDAEQIAWWQDLLIRGLGEFFYINDINFTIPDLVRWNVTAPPTEPQPWQGTPSERIMIPVGGGKDSAVTLHALQGVAAAAFALNPTPAVEQSIAVAGIADTIRVRRSIDAKLLDLNAQGYLNGHTPFSAYLAFLTTFCAALFDYRYIAVSNERSSNEGNEWFHGYEVNHQYSKTYDFEQKFQHYSQRYLAPHIHYFSSLRPGYELQIARAFAQLTAYHGVFRSCNRGQKTNTWCHDCPKCLFVYTMLYPFLGEEGLIGNIFQADLFAKESLLTTAEELAGIAQVKPFECVGTREESTIAFYLARERLRAEGKPLPLIIAHIDAQLLQHEPDLAERAQHLLSAWNTQHAIPTQYVEAIRQALLG